MSPDTKTSTARRSHFHRGAASTANATPGRVRWRRFAIMFVPAAAVAAGLVTATANGALAASFSISGQQGEVSADSLVGSGFEQFGNAEGTAASSIVPVAQSEIASADITNLCQSLTEVLPLGLGTVTLTIKGGTGGTPAHASSLIIDANQLSGSTATFTNVEQGIDASKLTEVPGAPVGIAGNYAQQADGIEIDNLQEVSYATSAGTFTLPGFSMSLTSGTSGECFPGGPENNFSL